MSGQSPTDKPSADATINILVHAEDAVVSKRVRRTLVRAARTTSTRDQVIEADLEHVHIVIERITIDRVVDEIPPVRTEGDVTIVSVVEEELVVVRRLVLKEEVHLRTVRRTVNHVETVELRKQSVSISRIPLND